MERKLRSLFEFQRFEKDPRLQQLIDETENRCGRELTDDEVGFANAAAGYLQVSAWRDYLTMQIIPQLYAARNAAPASDQGVVSSVISGLQGTMVPGADVSGPFYSLFSNYFNGWRSSMQSGSARQTVDNALYSARNYLEANS